jgi:hypothetical protein
MYDIPRYMRSLVESLKPEIKIEGIESNSGVYKVLTCDTMYINIHRRLIVNGNIEVKVTDFKENKSFSFIFTGNPPAIITKIEIKPFNFFHGTAQLTNAELDAIKDHKEKVPFVWLYAVFNEIETSNKSRAYEKSADLRLFILDESQYSNWFHQHHRDKVVIPLLSYKEKIKQALKKSTEVYDYGDITVTEHINFGRFVQKGNIDKIFSDELSGLELKFNIRMSYDRNCKC